MHVLYIIVMGGSAGLLWEAASREEYPTVRWTQRLFGIALIFLGASASTLLCGGCL